MSQLRLPRMLEACEGVDAVVGLIAVLLGVVAYEQPAIQVSMLFAGSCLYFASLRIRGMRLDDSQALRARIGLIVGAVGALGLLVPGIVLIVALREGGLWFGVPLLCTAVALCALNGLAVLLGVIERGLPDRNTP